MTPTLVGRWQIRVFLLATVGLIISLIVSLLMNKSIVPLFALLYVLLFGLVWDVIYQIITSFRWDRDWPTSFQVAVGIIEGALLWGLILTKRLPGIEGNTPPFIVFLIQYGLIWLSIFLLTQGPLRIFSVHWRYQGGQWFMSHRQRPEDQVAQQYPAPALPAASGGFPALPPQVISGGFQPVSPQAISGGFQPVSPQDVSGGFQPPSGGFQPIPQQVASGGFQPPSGGFQPPPSQPVRQSNPVHQQSPAGLAAFQAVQPLPPGQPAQPYVCACGVTSDRQVGNFCPGCGSPKV